VGRKGTKGWGGGGRAAGSRGGKADENKGIDVTASIPEMIIEIRRHLNFKF